MHIGITRERTKRSIFRVTLKRKRKEKEEEFPVGISEATNLFSIVESSFVVALPQDLVKKGWLLSWRHGSTVRICEPSPRWLLTIPAQLLFKMEQRTMTVCQQKIFYQFPTRQLLHRLSFYRCTLPPPFSKERLQVMDLRHR